MSIFVALMVVMALMAKASLHLPTGQGRWADVAAMRHDQAADNRPDH
jgi:hypothetical protein